MALDQLKFAWYLTDKLGTVRDLADASGALLNHIDYDSFGRIIAQSNALAGDRFTFTGREWDSDVELYYYRARFYDPRLGRFVSQDPIGFAADDPNLYRYVFNSPLVGTDPTGHNVFLFEAAAIEYDRRLAEGVLGHTFGYACGFLDALYSGNPDPFWSAAKGAAVGFGIGYALNSLPLRTALLGSIAFLAWGAQDIVQAAQQGNAPLLVLRTTCFSLPLLWSAGRFGGTGCFLGDTEIVLAEHISPTATDERASLWHERVGPLIVILCAGGLALGCYPRRRRRRLRNVGGASLSKSVSAALHADDTDRLSAESMLEFSGPEECLVLSEADRLTHAMRAHPQAPIAEKSAMFGSDGTLLSQAFSQPNDYSCGARKAKAVSGISLGSVALALATCALVLLATLNATWPESSQPLASHANRSKPIDQVVVGDRVASEYPTTLGAPPHDFGNVDFSTWHKLTLLAKKNDGTVTDIVLLRPNSWLDEHSARVGETVAVSVPECGIDGHAEVLSIERCPRIAQGGGGVVTGTFRHSSAHIVAVSIACVNDPIRTTANHPFWSERRRRFARADELQVGESLRTLTGVTQVIRVARESEPQTVYNLEVHGSHVYHVTRSGVLVHNSTPTFGSGVGSLFGDLGSPVGTNANGSTYGYTDTGVYWEHTSVGKNTNFYPLGRDGALRIQHNYGHPPLPGETFNPRHHGEHWHVEQRTDLTIGWSNKNKANIRKALPPGYRPGTGTGFLPGESVPTCAF